ncbi:M42 family metallopeptidase [Pullulanibacillus sp. KACC 23026]|uniref:M42 family metallopeptidase n=1 Tax=Pullulanibacillus sp. KACC 23026 TaxID=3028315 RepID=UPI0023B0E131|nr:M42 family metallopeptidase [Pullulanibacillus sp. KACC 23026]WEG13923.1 M42 family metallopeptidase [Pullulanibacillus sp. KACC 23026]
MVELDQSLQMLKDLTDAKGIPGNEAEPRQVMKTYIEPFADQIQYDGLGSLIAEKVGEADGPKIMVAGHLDEVGFMVTQIDEKGFLRFQTVGGWWSQVMLAQRVTVVTNSGEVPGVIGSKPPHILDADARKKPFEIKDMFIDIGAESKEEAQSFGVRPGDMVVPVCDFTVMKNPKYLLAKALDNRIGCAIAIDVLKQLKNEAHPNRVYGVGTVQEEVGLRGATTAAHVIQPDIALTVDTGIPGDTPGITEKEALSELGKGPQIIIYDASMVAHKGVRDFVTGVADKLGIPYQFDAVPGGGTDSGKIHLTGKGVPSLSITIATRYLHTAASIIHRDDYENAVKLIVACIKELDKEKVQAITLD